MDAKLILKHMGKFSWLLIFIPISIYYGFYTHETVPTVITTILAIIPLAAAIGYATEELVLHLNPAWGGLINATFGNIIELIVAGLALQRGLIELVQASIVGSILGNILLLMGLSIFAGGLRHKDQCFNARTAGVSSTMLIIAIAGLALPTVYYYAYNPPFQKVQILSDAVALVLALTYIAGLLFSLKTHKHLFDSGEAIKEHEKTSLTKKDAILLLVITTGIAALLSEILVGNIEHAGESIGWSQTFIGAIVVAIIANVAEKYSAITFGAKNKLDVSLEIGMGSATQIALFVVPLLVFLSQFNGYEFTLVFTIFELVCMLFAVLIVNDLSSDGVCNWLEGVQLIAVYFIIAIIFYFV